MSGKATAASPVEAGPAIDAVPIKTRGFRQSMAWLHTWAGLLVGWVLFMVFAFGTASYYRTTITNWMQPERSMAAVTADGIESLAGTASTSSDAVVTDATDQNGNARRDRDAALSPHHQTQLQATARAVDWLTQHAGTATRWTLSLPGSGVSNTSASWEDAEGYHTQILPGANGLTPRATEGGDFFYNFHFQLRYLPIRIARWIVSACAMSMLIALISGIVTHRRIFVDFFTFRPRKGQRSWLDAHNVTAVLALPYHLMITYTGLATLMVMLMPWGMKERYPTGGVLAYYGDVYDFALAGKASGHPLTLPPVAPLLRDAMGRFGNHEATTITIDNPGDAAAQIKVSRGSDARLSVAAESVTYDVHGRMTASRLDAGAAANTVGVLYGLHEARFASPVLRAVFFLSGLAGTLMVASGLIIWTNKQRQKQRAHGGRFHLGLWLVERLNLATIGGVPFAMAAYFYANRLIPALQAERAALEVQVFFAAWAIAAVHALIHCGRRAWIAQCLTSALAFTLLPIVDRFTVGTWVMPGFDIALWTSAALLASMAWFIAAPSRRPPSANMAKPRQRRAPSSSLSEPR